MYPRAVSFNRFSVITQSFPKYLVDLRETELCPKAPYSAIGRFRKRNPRHSRYRLHAFSHAFDRETNRVREFLVQ